MLNKGEIDFIPKRDRHNYGEIIYGNPYKVAKNQNDEGSWNNLENELVLTIWFCTCQCTFAGHKKLCIQHGLLNMHKLVRPKCNVEDKLYTVGKGTFVHN